MQYVSGLTIRLEITIKKLFSSSFNRKPVIFLYGNRKKRVLVLAGIAWPIRRVFFKIIHLQFIYCNHYINFVHTILMIKKNISNRKTTQSIHYPLYLSPIDWSERNLHLNGGESLERFTYLNAESKLGFAFL